MYVKSAINDEFVWLIRAFSCFRNQEINIPACNFPKPLKTLITKPAECALAQSYGIYDLLLKHFPVCETHSPTLINKTYNTKDIK